ncbi:HAD-IIIC family phosphatase [Butyrivibrio sp. AE2032]|uniref:HAD-IIIC family phosphatase n=1 Tax=Butyrivibrio sp. AE2032 TaxID=1458463 RepID=UPI000550BD31|nr:HAD-IIIC family phosphatase [Butyrivibrio sp. AE2032]
MKQLEYPYDSDFILRKKKAIRRELLAREGIRYIEKKIAILGGSTTSDIKLILELFLLNYGIKAEFYESEYNKYYEDAVFGNPELDEFKPDLVFVHTTTRNIARFPQVTDSAEQIDTLLEETMARFEQIWSALEQRYKCTVIQNNFEQPFYRLLGNSDFTNIHGRLNFINRLNEGFCSYAQAHQNFFINDINYVSAVYGIKKWADPGDWYRYKYALSVSAIPDFAFNLAHIIKAVYGRNKKAFALDMDNTLWGGIVGDDGPENIKVGHEDAESELFTEFQQYIKAHKDLGILLTVASKNDEENALAGLARPDSTLKQDDFILIKANWENKDRNISNIAQELNIGADSFVFVDDNPVERALVETQIPGISVPEVGAPETYIDVIDSNGFFEVTGISEEDLKRGGMYKANMERAKASATFDNYDDYLKSLEMKAEIKPFSPVYMARIAELTNKSNQFNLTTKRCSQAEIESFASDPSYITLYGRLEDKFGDNGVVAVTFGHEEDGVFHIDLWLMSCRVLKRGMEFAMMDELISEAKSRNITKIKGYYYPTAKNKMVSDFYALQGFTKINETEDGSTEWLLDLAEPHKSGNIAIKVN